MLYISKELVCQNLKNRAKEESLFVNNRLVEAYSFQILVNLDPRTALMKDAIPELYRPYGQRPDLWLKEVISMYSKDMVDLIKEIMA